MANPLLRPVNRVYNATAKNKYRTGNDLGAPYYFNPETTNNTFIFHLGTITTPFHKKDSDRNVTWPSVLLVVAVVVVAVVVIM